LKIDDCDTTTKEKIREVCQELFHNNYITEYVFATNESLKKANASYSFVMLHYDVIEELLDQCGWRLRHDEGAGVLYLSSDYAKAKVILTKSESYILLALRLIYDDNKSRASATGEVYVTARDIIEQLTTLGALDGVPKQKREESLRTLARKNIISKIAGKWGDIDARIAILPSIVCAISSDKTKAVLEMLTIDDDDEIEVEEEEEQA